MVFILAVTLLPGSYMSTDQIGTLLFGLRYIFMTLDTILTSSARKVMLERELGHNPKKNKESD